MKTINDLIVNGHMAQEYFLNKLGYDEASFDYVRADAKERVVFSFDLMDDFQRQLPQEMKYKVGWLITVPGDKLWQKLEAWPNREQRELTILARKATALDADLSKIKSAQVHAFVAQLMPTIEELRRQITFNDTTEIE